MYNTIDSLNPAAWVPNRPAGAGPMASLRAWIARHWPRREPEFTHDELVELDAHLLADIGAPEALLSRALARRELQEQERACLHAGVAAGAWRHW